MRPLLAWLSRLFRSTDGSVTVEAVIMLPALAWCYLGTYVFFDAYRSQTVNIKTAYTIADTLSREEDYITAGYIDGLVELQTFLVATTAPIALRVSVISYDEDTGAHGVLWSEGRGRPVLTAADLVVVRDQIPLMADADVALVVETWVDYVPPFGVGLNGFTYQDFVVTRPRFGSRLCFNTVEGGDFTTAIC